MRNHFPIAVALLCFLAASGVSQSLGDIARQQRFLKPAPTARVITNDDIAARSGKKDQLARADITPAIEISIPKRDSRQQSPDDVQAKILLPFTTPTDFLRDSAPPRLRFVRTPRTEAPAVWDIFEISYRSPIAGKNKTSNLDPI